MILCSLCGAQNETREICEFHHYTPPDDDWSASNRVMCDFFHRGVVPPRLTATERDPEALFTIDNAHDWAG